MIACVFSLNLVAQKGQGVMVVDAGGGTIDLSAYYMSGSPPSFEEIAPTECESFRACGHSHSFR